jgi:hypothetical protein
MTPPNSFGTPFTLAGDGVVGVLERPEPDGLLVEIRLMAQ